MFSSSSVSGTEQFLLHSTKHASAWDICKHHLTFTGSIYVQSLAYGQYLYGKGEKVPSNVHNMPYKFVSQWEHTFSIIWNTIYNPQEGWTLLCRQTLSYNWLLTSCNCARWVTGYVWLTSIKSFRHIPRDTCLIPFPNMLWKHLIDIHQNFVVRAICTCDWKTAVCYTHLDCF